MKRGVSFCFSARHFEAFYRQTLRNTRGIIVRTGRSNPAVLMDFSTSSGNNLVQRRIIDGVIDSMSVIQHDNDNTNLCNCSYNHPLITLLTLWFAILRLRL